MEIAAKSILSSTTWPEEREQPSLLVSETELNRNNSIKSILTTKWNAITARKDFPETRPHETRIIKKHLLRYSLVFLLLEPESRFIRNHGTYLNHCQGFARETKSITQKIPSGPVTLELAPEGWDAFIISHCLTLICFSQVDINGDLKCFCFIFSYFKNIIVCWQFYVSWDLKTRLCELLVSWVLSVYIIHAIKLYFHFVCLSHFI